jgi:hypothetical protein
MTCANIYNGYEFYKTTRIDLLGSGLCPSSEIKKLEHDVSETGSVSTLG